MSMQYGASQGAPRLRFLKVAAAGVLVVGGASGLIFNRTASVAAAKAPVDDAGLTALAEPLPVADPVVSVGEGDRRVLFSLKSVQSEALPPDPFRPVPLHREIPRSPLLSQAASLEIGPASPLDAAPVAAPKPAPAARPAAPAAPAAPAVSADDIALTGVINGEPPLAVVQFQGQSLFLKIGEQVADSWRLVEIKERSAIFQMGGRRVEVPVKGGSSE